MTNVPEETRTFARRLADKGALGAVYRPFVGDTCYLVASDEDWNGIATMHRLAPVCLTYPHGTPQLVAVVGGETIWEGTPEPKLASLEPLLRCFAASAGLAFVEMAFAQTGDATCVIAVEPSPQLEHFSDATRSQIVEGVVSLLTTETRHGRKDTGEFSTRLL